MILFDADDPLVLNGTYDREGYKPGERARLAKQRARAVAEGAALTAPEVDALVTAVQSVYCKLGNLWVAVTPLFEQFGFAPPSPGVLARELSERIEAAVVQHCATFTAGEGYADLQRHGARWEVKVCQRAGLVINQCARVRGEHYLVVNYRATGTAVQVVRIWVLWNADDRWFTPRRANSNARRVLPAAAKAYGHVLFQGETR